MILKLKKTEVNLINALAHEEELSVGGLTKLLNIKNIFSIINELIRKEIVQIKEDLHDKYKEDIFVNVMIAICLL